MLDISKYKTDEDLLIVKKGTSSLCINTGSRFTYALFDILFLDHFIKLNLSNKYEHKSNYFYMVRQIEILDPKIEYADILDIMILSMLAGKLPFADINQEIRY